MKFNVLGTTGILASVALLAACATTEEEVIEVVEEPVIEEPAMSKLEMAQMELEENVGHRVFFGYDQYNLTPEAQATLRRQAAFLMMPENADLRIRIEGNCDERGTREYNLALGERRAEAAKAFLVGLGVEPTRISTVSYGKERPIDPRSTPEAWAKNRNATTRIVGDTEAMI
ncbi:peptidoglycan-associated lipoprotein Pal [Parvularcula lutaonensis]|uniref:Peptidoglycan-associated lipoprotein n=1 Tax=Parvularcula lutaonensis TaxID=491923 RepID=A0ABV7MDN0_9PROT|nr:peptidoglycan-associated lipoprotein Pal [Parvularcula lutaonensis]GGY53617.1 peptidoglycan-associated lipoprotein [Parvularcula lutaonensis]